MIWKIEFIVSADREFSKIPKDMQKRITTYLKKLIEDPRAYGIAMQGSDTIKLWRYRLGDYRLVCL
jgi:mRNA interferase RelE/StbE